MQRCNKIDGKEAFLMFTDNNLHTMLGGSCKVIVSTAGKYF